jgi:adenylylsulfate kinase
LIEKKYNIMNKNVIHQDYEVSLESRQKLNGHRSFLVWLTGLSGSGKSTLADKAEAYFHNKGKHTFTLDGDNTRKRLNADLGFSKEDREENLRRVAETANLMVDAGMLTFAAFISPLNQNRETVKKIVGADNYLEIYVKASVETCEKRDVKGLYKKARKGEIKDFTGISAPYEEPENPDLVVDSEKEPEDDCLKKIIELIEDRLPL